MKISTTPFEAQDRRWNSNQSQVCLVFGVNGVSGRSHQCASQTLGPDADEEADQVPDTAQEEAPGVPPEEAQFWRWRQLPGSQATGDSIAEQFTRSMLDEQRVL